MTWSEWILAVCGVLLLIPGTAWAALWMCLTVSRYKKAFVDILQWHIVGRPKADERLRVIDMVRYDYGCGGWPEGPGHCTMCWGDCYADSLEKRTRSGEPTAEEMRVVDREMEASDGE